MEKCFLERVRFRNSAPRVYPAVSEYSPQGPFSQPRFRNIGPRPPFPLPSAGSPDPCQVNLWNFRGENFAASLEPPGRDQGTLHKCFLLVPGGAAALRQWVHRFNDCQLPPLVLVPFLHYLAKPLNKGGGKMAHRAR